MAFRRPQISSLYTAHRGALAARGRTLAVLGTGLDHVYPVAHQELAEQVVSQGALLSQFSPSFTGYPGGGHFKKRNAIVSGLSQLVLVVEAKLHSGTADTIRKALAQGRKVGLLSSLVESQHWAAQLAEHHQVFTIREAYCVLKRLEMSCLLYPSPKPKGSSQGSIWVVSGGSEIISSFFSSSTPVSGTS